MNQTKGKPEIPQKDKSTIHEPAVIKSVDSAPIEKVSKTVEKEKITVSAGKKKDKPIDDIILNKIKKVDLRVIIASVDDLIAGAKKIDNTITSQTAGWFNQVTSYLNKSVDSYRKGK